MYHVGRQRMILNACFLSVRPRFAGVCAQLLWAGDVRGPRVGLPVGGMPSVGAASLS